MGLILQLALRYLVARVRQSLLTIGGIVLGVLALTVIQAMMGGFRQHFVTTTLGTAPHVSVRREPLEPFDPTSPTRVAAQQLQDSLLVEAPRPPIPDEQEAIRNPEVLRERIREIPGVVAAAPVASGQVMFGFSGIWEPVTLNGIVPGDHSRVVDFAGKLRDGTVSDLEGNNSAVVLGKYLAERMRVGVADRVVARSQRGGIVSLRIVAIHSSMVYDVDNTNAWVNLSRAQALLGLGSSVNAIQVKTADYNTADQVARRIEYAIGMRAESWMEANSNILGLLQMMITMMFLVTAFTMAVAGFGIAGNLITTVSEKTFDIGVLKAMGMRAGQLSLVFLVLSMLMMAIGLTVGLSLSYLAVETLSRTPSAVKPMEGVLVTSETIPVLKDWTIYAFSAAFAMVVSVFAGISPAMRAARLEPLNIIRGTG